METLGQNLENCWTLEHKIQDFIDVRLIHRSAGHPRYPKKPLPSHSAVGPSINMIRSRVMTVISILLGKLFPLVVVHTLFLSNEARPLHLLRLNIPHSILSLLSVIHPQNLSECVCHLTLAPNSSQFIHVLMLHLNLNFEVMCPNLVA